MIFYYVNAGKYFTLYDAVKSILPEFFHPADEEEGKDGVIKLVRIQGIEPKMEIPFSWVVNNLMNPDYFLHICVYINAGRPMGT